ncbi:MAG: hypothetical protein HYX41_07570 [Bdellovibrio sp.]|nr:hypothetical protein [Bdellovibrio sp.]
MELLSSEKSCGLFSSIGKTIGVLALACGFGLSAHEGFAANFDLSLFNQLEQPFAGIVIPSESTQNEEIQLARVTTDMAEGHSDFKMEVNSDHAILAMRYYLSNGTRADFTLEQVKGGVVLVKASGRDVLKLKGEKLDANHGGLLDLIYLSNGVTNKYETLQFELVRTGDRWSVMVNDQGGRREFTTMFFKGRKFFGQWVGIEKITVK